MEENDEYRDLLAKILEEDDNVLDEADRIALANIDEAEIREMTLKFDNIADPLIEHNLRRHEIFYYQLK